MPLTRRTMRAAVATLAVLLAISSALAYPRPAAIAEVIRLFGAGRREEAARLHAKIAKFRLTIQDYAPIPAQKRLLALWSGESRWANVRPPLLPMSEDEGQELADLLDREHGFRGLTAEAAPA